MQGSAVGCRILAGFSAGGKGLPCPEKLITIVLPAGSLRQNAVECASRCMLPAEAYKVYADVPAGVRERQGAFSGPPFSLALHCTESTGAAWPGQRLPPLPPCPQESILAISGRV